MRAIIRIICSDRYFVYTSQCFGQGEYLMKCEEMDLRIAKSIVDEHLEAEESVEYVKSLLTEI